MDNQSRITLKLSSSTLSSSTMPLSWFKYSLITLAATFGLNTASASAQSFDTFVSGPGTGVYLGGGALLPLITDGDKGGQHSLRIIDALATSAALCYGAKSVIQSPRPDNEKELDSFPSCHATTAFAVARMQSQYHPDWAIAWYAGATLIGYSRISEGRHRWYDVAAGAALGYLVGEVELSQKRGLLLFPLIREDSQGNSIYGMQVRAEF
jgi:membrane-associated phospholipid phosphatase